MQKAVLNKLFTYKHKQANTSLIIILAWLCFCLFPVSLVNDIDSYSDTFSTKSSIDVSSDTLSLEAYVDQFSVIETRLDAPFQTQSTNIYKKHSNKHSNLIFLLSASLSVLFAINQEFFNYIFFHVFSSSTSIIKYIHKCDGQKDKPLKICY